MRKCANEPKNAGSRGGANAMASNWGQLIDCPWGCSPCLRATRPLAPNILPRPAVMANNKFICSAALLIPSAFQLLLLLIPWPQTTFALPHGLPSLDVLILHQLRPDEQRTSRQQVQHHQPSQFPLIRPISGAEMVLLNLFSLQKQVLNITGMNQSVIGNEASAASVLPASSSGTTPMPSAGINSTETASSFPLPAFELVLGTFTYLLIIGITILGNTLVILAVFSYRPLKKVQNYFIVSLAASDMLVALVVMPLHVVKFLANGRWLLGVTVCQLFTTADILLCTSSILNLCAIAIDRYWAIHDPIGYAQKRSLKLVCGMIVLVWVASAVISVPPLIGWNDWTSQTLVDHCELTSEKAFVVFSACGSFFLPLAVMVVVYVKIFLNARQRIRKNRGRSALFKMTEDLRSDKKKGSRMQRAPVAATSVIALASATGAQIFRKRLGGSLKERTSSTTTSSSHEAKPAEAEGEKFCVERESRPSADSGLGGPPMSGASNKESSDFPLPSPLAKRHSLGMEPNLQLPHPNLAGSTSLLVLPINEAVQQQNGGARIESKSPDTVELKKHLKEREKISVAKEKRAAKTIAVIIFVFTFCWLPFFCAYVIMPFCTSCYLHPKVHQAFVWLGYINSSLNPFLYGILNLEFRRAFRKLLCPKRVQNAQRRKMSAQVESLRRKQKC